MPETNWTFLCNVDSWNDLWVYLVLSKRKLWEIQCIAHYILFEKIFSPPAALAPVALEPILATAVLL